MKNTHLIIAGLFGLILGILIAKGINSKPVFSPRASIDDYKLILDNDKKDIYKKKYDEAVIKNFETPVVYDGKVSYYTTDGCLGCNPDRITASGEVLDNNKLTTAIPAQWRKSIPMGTMVQITNNDNNKSVIVKANDTGGFLKYNRIADLSFATCEAINCTTDKSNISIKVIVKRK